MVWKDHPRRAVNHVGEFFAKEVEELMCGLMGAPGDSVIALGEGPWRGGKYDRETASAEVAKEGARWVNDMGEVGQVAVTAAQAK